MQPLTRSEPLSESITKELVGGNMDVGYKDLREWLAQAEKMGEVREEKSIDLKEDVGRIAEISAAT